MIKKTVLEYKTVADSGLKKFDESINKSLRSGWSLYGSPYCVKMPDAHESFSNKYQVMVREITIEVEGDDVGDGEIC